MNQAARTTFGLAALFPIVITALPAHAQMTGGCDCRDIAQIQYRIQEDANVISSYGDWILKHPDDLIESTEMQRTVLQQVNALNTTNNRLDSPFSGNGKLAATGGLFCNTTPPTMDLTPCLKHALDLHEAVHREYCDRTHGNGHFYTATASEEIRSYRTERDFLVAERKRLLCNCDYYAIKLERTDDLNVVTAPETQTQRWELWNSPPMVPTRFVQIPLQVKNGNVSGAAAGNIRVNMKFTSGTMICTLYSKPSPGQDVTIGTIAEDFSVKGMLTAAFAPVLTTTTGPFSGQTDCSSATGSASGASQQRIGDPVDSALHFSKIDEPVDQVTAVQGEKTDFKSTLVVNDKWVGTTASNGLGATVDAALRAIGLTIDC